jgi:hypothetical protein
MKTTLTFNHEAKNLGASMGFTDIEDTLSQKMASMSVGYVTSSAIKASHLAEEIHNKLSYEEILFLAAQSAVSILNDFMENR